MTLHELHSGPVPFLLPNAWDVASALAFVEAGFPAVGTTSFGVNAANGVPDGHGASKAGTRTLVHRLRSLPAYVTADVEDGFSEHPQDVAAFVAELGVDGVNLEDSDAPRLVAPRAHAAKVAAVKAAAPRVFVNARVDTYWFGVDATVKATVARALAYVDAGADGIFVPGVTDPAVIEQLAAAIPVPLNVLVVPGRTLQQHADLGVRRVSCGSLPYRAALDAAVGVATTMRDGGLAPSATSYAELQRRLEQHVQRPRSQT